MTRPFFDSFAIIIILSSLSLIVTFSLVASGVPLYALKIAHLDLTGYDYLQNYGDVSFPFTFIANDANSWFGFVPRSGGLFREPGVFPPFACWAAAYAYLRKWSLPWIAVCLLASVLSLSTVGPLAFFTGAILLAYKFRIRPIRALILIALLGAALWPALYSMEFIGLEDKIASQSGSFADRQVLFWGAFDVKNIMFGDGFGWGGVSSTEGISLVSQMRVYGVIYVVTVVAIYICAMKNIKLWIAGCLPGFITVLFSQPISTDAAFLVIFFSWAAFQETSPRDTGSKMHPGSSRRLMPFCLPTN
jgi:hypothetical protein